METFVYTLYDENKSWLGQVVLTSDGMFSSVTEYGNMAFAWRSFGDDFRKFILSLNIPYFSSKMYLSNSYIWHGRKAEKACDKFAEMILPALKSAITEDLSSENSGKPNN